MDKEPLDAAATLANSLDKLTRGLQEAKTYGRHSRKIVWALVITFTLDICLTVILAIVAVNASVDRHNLASEAILSCEHTDQVRSNTADVLNDILRLPAIGSPQFITPANAKLQAAQVSAIKADIAQAFVPTKCLEWELTGIVAPHAREIENYQMTDYKDMSVDEQIEQLIEDGRIAIGKLRETADRLSKLSAERERLQTIKDDFSKTATKKL